MSVLQPVRGMIAKWAPSANSGTLTKDEYLIGEMLVGTLIQTRTAVSTEVWHYWGYNSAGGGFAIPFVSIKNMPMVRVVHWQGLVVSNFWMPG